MNPMIYVVDDDHAVRQSVVNLLTAEGFEVNEFASGSAFLSAQRPSVPSCLICDMAMPEVGGLQVAAELMRQEFPIPIIFMTGYGSIPLTVQAMKAGAMEFLTKPVVPEDLLSAVSGALAIAHASHTIHHELAELRLRHASLTPRERETMALVIGGLLLKQVARELGVSEIMAKIHKRKVMEKMGARSLPDLVRHAVRLQVVKSSSR